MFNGKGDPEYETRVDGCAARNRAQRLKLVIGIDFVNCLSCGSAIRMIARVGDFGGVQRMRTHPDEGRVEREALRRRFAGGRLSGVVRLTGATRRRTSSDCDASGEATVTAC